MNQDERVCVYDIVLKGEVVYVGMTKNPAVRIMGHRQTGNAPEGAKMVVHKWYESRKEAGKAEKERQRDLKPAFCRDLVSPRKGVSRPTFDSSAYKKAADEFNKQYTVEQVNEYIQRIGQAKTHNDILQLCEIFDKTA